MNISYVDVNDSKRTRAFNEELNAKGAFYDSERMDDGFIYETDNAEVTFDHIPEFLSADIFCERAGDFLKEAVNTSFKRRHVGSYVFGDPDKEMTLMELFKSVKQWSCVTVSGAIDCGDFYIYADNLRIIVEGIGDKILLRVASRFDVTL